MTGNAQLGPVCMRCGREADFDFGPFWLCLDCYHIAGSTCAGVGQPRSTARSDQRKGREQHNPVC
jgi:ribosomal protein L37E